MSVSASCMSASCMSGPPAGNSRQECKRPCTMWHDHLQGCETPLRLADDGTCAVQHHMQPHTTPLDVLTPRWHAVLPVPAGHARRPSTRGQGPGARAVRSHAQQAGDHHCGGHGPGHRDSGCSGRRSGAAHLPQPPCAWAPRYPSLHPGLRHAGSKMTRLIGRKEQRY